MNSDNKSVPRAIWLCIYVVIIALTIIDWITIHFLPINCYRILTIVVFGLNTIAQLILIGKGV